MKFCFVGLGAVEIPPKGWGAVEIIIWDYKTILEGFGHTVKIVNTLDREQIIKEIDEFAPDVCHCHYDGYYNILERCNARLKIITSHCGSIRGSLSDDLRVRDEVLPHIGFRKFYNFCLDSFIRDLYISKGFNPARQFVIPNAARRDLIEFEATPRTTDTVCIGKILPRKRQELIQDLNVFFIGDYDSGGFDPNNKRLLGSWTKDKIYKELTHNANLVLLSKSEAAPLVVLEAMMAGLGLVISEACVANLDVDKPFIDVIPERYMNDLDYIDFIIQKNKKKSLMYRWQIREYASLNHSYDVIIPQYLNLVERLIS